MDSIFSTVTSFFALWSAELWATLCKIAPYLIVGLVLAGLLRVLVPARVVLWALGHRGWQGALRGALLGVVLPLNRSSVLPTALTLRGKGASLSVATSFAISASETSFDTLALTLAMMPMAFLGVRPLAAVLLAIGVGSIVELFSTTTSEHLRLNILKFSRDIDAEKPGSPDAEVCRVCGLLTDSARNHVHSTGMRFVAIFRYAFGPFFREIATRLALGLLLAALVQLLLPEQVLGAGWLARHPNIQILLALLLGVPLYAFPAALTPLVAVLLAKGLSPGAALVLVLAGLGSNIGNVFALRKEFGARTTAIHYGALFVFCCALGVACNVLWPLIDKHTVLTSVVTDPVPRWAEAASALLLVILALTAWVSGTVAWARARGHVS